MALGVFAADVQYLHVVEGVARRLAAS